MCQGPWKIGLKMWDEYMVTQVRIRVGINRISKILVIKKVNTRVNYFLLHGVNIAKNTLT
jgi:hypothetical protein